MLGLLFSQLISNGMEEFEESASEHKTKAIFISTVFGI